MPELPSNIARLGQIVRDCTLCPRNCHVDRAGPKRGACRIGLTARVNSVGPHFGEEPVLVGRGGSGTIFLSACNLDCVFCQNADISHSATGQELTPRELAGAAVRLERAGCENVSFVTADPRLARRGRGGLVSTSDGIGRAGGLQLRRV